MRKLIDKTGSAVLSLEQALIVIVCLFVIPGLYSTSLGVSELLELTEVAVEIYYHLTTIDAKLAPGLSILIFRPNKVCWQC